MGSMEGEGLPVHSTGTTGVSPQINGILIDIQLIMDERMAGRGERLPHPIHASSGPERWRILDQATMMYAPMICLAHVLRWWGERLLNAYTAGNMHILGLPSCFCLLGAVQ